MEMICILTAWISVYFPPVFAFLLSLTTPKNADKQSGQGQD